MGKIDLQPLPGYALAQLPKKYESGLSVEKEKYSTNSSGTLVSVRHSNASMNNVYIDTDAVSVYEQYIGSTVYFTPFEDGDVIKLNEDEYVFVPIEKLRGGKL